MASAQEIQQIASLLESSLNPATAKQAESTLKLNEGQSGFAILLLHVVATSSLPQISRLAGALFFKNFIRRKWTDENRNYLIPVEDAKAVKKEIIGLMITLPTSLQVQLGESVSIIADSDFPDRWPELIDDLVFRLSSTDVVSNNGVLQVAHSIFKRWRPLYRSDALFSEIKLVLDKFCIPFMSLFQQTDALISQNQNNKDALLPLFHSMQLIFKVYFDLNCQDIPEFFEDNIALLMGLVHKYLSYTNPLLITEDEDESGPLEESKASICELIQLYSQRYDDVFRDLLPSFVETTWNLLTTTGPEPKYDVLISKALGFLTAICKSPERAKMFGSEDILKQVVEKIVLPNMSLRPSDEELFEDDPIEYTRRDLEGSDSDTRRRAATDFLRELKERFESLVTEVVMSYVQHYLQQYNANPTENWRSKDTAVYLFSSVAVKGTVTASGVSATNLLLDVVGFFSQNVAPDLISGNIQSILKVDAIKFIHTFRNQLTKQQLAETFPVLSSMFLSPDYVVFTYAAITIERILSMKNSIQKTQMQFDKNDIAPIAEDLLINLFRLIEKGQTPEKLAENEFLMRCCMRVIITAKESIVGYSDAILPHLVGIITETSKNPSNPKFTHYTFESLSAVIRFAAPSKPSGSFDSVLIPVFLEILGQDVTEFIPYVFQLLAQLLDVAPRDASFPSALAPLVRPLLAPSLWETKGNVPALTHLLESMLSRNPEIFVTEGLIEPVLGVFQKLLSSRLNDHFGIELLEYVLYYIPIEHLQKYTRQIAMLILQRLQTSRTEKLVVRVAHLVYFLSAVTDPAKNLGPNFSIGLVDQAQAGIFGEVFTAFVVPATSKLHSSAEKKVAVIGLARILFDAPGFLQSNPTKWQIGLSGLVNAIKSDSLVGVFESTDPMDDLSLDRGDEDVVFSASFSKLATVSVSVIDPAPEIASDISSLKKFTGSMIQKSMSGGLKLPQNAPQEIQDALHEFVAMA
ncbi:Cse1-domain-containing protein [Lipomyces oligophaga]|uniref:Cse1-domain-containing protein n=1 Tax=Lipomyces oligophaga TaxID=45792 RepID=UPI0034CE8716